MADERDPAGDRLAGTARERVEHRTLAVEHFRGRRGEGALVDVPAPGSDRAADADATHAHGDVRSGCATVPASTASSPRSARALGAGEHRGELVVAAGVRAVQRHRPVEDRAAGGRLSGMQLRASGSPVRCWSAFTIPGVTTQSRASSSGVPGQRVRSSEVEPTATMRSPAIATVPPSRTSRRGFIVTTSPPVTSRSAADAGPEPPEPPGPDSGPVLCSEPIVGQRTWAFAAVASGRGHNQTAHGYAPGTTRRDHDVPRSRLARHRSVPAADRGRGAARRRAPARRRPVDGRARSRSWVGGDAGRGRRRDRRRRAGPSTTASGDACRWRAAGRGPRRRGRPRSGPRPPTPGCARRRSTPARRRRRRSPTTCTRPRHAFSHAAAVVRDLHGDVRRRLLTPRRSCPGAAPRS